MRNISLNSKEWIDVNIRHHDKYASRYKKNHIEIYNKIEQERLGNALKSIIDSLKEEVKTPLALDFGAGAGNLTGHLLGLGCQVVTTDVSQGCLEHVVKLFQRYDGMISTSVLNGEDLSQFKDDHFDLCAAYSVLHHVPDYLNAVRELARVVKPGGYIFIDHESSPQAWEASKEKSNYINQIRQLNKQSIWSRWGPKGLWYRIIIKWHKKNNPRYQVEGDIHIWEDDHIEWKLIENVLRENGFSNIQRKDYLVCRENVGKESLYEKYKDIYHDMSMMVAIKN